MAAGAYHERLYTGNRARPIRSESVKPVCYDPPQAMSTKPNESKLIDAQRLRSEVEKLYARVSTEPDGQFHFHRGIDYAVDKLLYDRSELKALPVSSTEVFAGVANPHVIEPLQNGEKVLDVGCGGGTDLLLAARHVGSTGRAIGVDMTEQMLDRCKTSADQCGMFHVDVRFGDAENLPIESGSVDVVISNGVLNLVPDKGKAFREMHRVLRPG